MGSFGPELKRRRRRRLPIQRTACAPAILRL